MNLSQCKIIMQASIFFQFGYYPLEWMFHSRLYNRINNIHERALWIIYRDLITLFEELLKKDKSATIHWRNLQIPATENFQTKNRSNPEIMKNIFHFIEPACHLRSNNRLEKHNVKCLRYRTEKISHLGPKIWNLLPEEYKEIDYLFSKEKFQIGKQMNVLVDYVKHICNI